MGSSPTAGSIFLSGEVQSIIREFEERFLRFVRDEELFSEGDIVLVAVSGGVDSTTLLFLLKKFSPILGISLIAAHLDHKIRSNSWKDRIFVEEFCERLGVPVQVSEVDVPSLWKGSDKTLEEVAREVRYNFLKETAKSVGATKIALAHHSDDLLETVIHRLVRGTGPLGLACMRPKFGVFVRPFLRFKREEIEKYAKFMGIPHVVDETNYDLRITRNFIRHKIVPLLKELNPEVENAVYRLVSISVMVRDFVEEFVDEFIKEKVEVQTEMYVFEKPENDFLLLEVVRKLLEQKYGRVPEYEKMESVLRNSKRVSFRTNLWSSVYVEKSYDYVAVGETVFRGRYRLPVEREVMEVFGFKIRVSCKEGKGERVWIRNRKPGDRIVVSGKLEKVKDLLIAHRVPTFYRDRLPLLVDEEDNVLWIPGVCVSDPLKERRIEVELLKAPKGFLKGG